MYIAVHDHLQRGTDTLQHSATQETRAMVVGGFIALGAGLFSSGIPTDSIMEYETKITADIFVFSAHGSPDYGSTTTRTGATTRHQEIKEHVCCT